MDSKKNNSGWVIKNLLLAILVISAIALLTVYSLKWITKYGQEVTVPDFSNMTFVEAEKLAKESGVRVYEGDSIYIKQMRKGAVYCQTPEAGKVVKKGRRIMLTTNTRKAKEVLMPSLVGFSLPQAKGELQNKGLTLGRLIYVRDIATNTVLEQKYKNSVIKPGRKIKAGSSIDLVLGLDQYDNRTIAPKLVGMTYVQAINAIHDAYLNVGKVRFDSDVKNYADTLKAIVYEQTPGPSAGICSMGTNVSIKLAREPK